MDKNNTFKTFMAAAYLRLSKEDTDLSVKYGKFESNSIVNQKALILKELSSMSNVDLHDIYIDDGFSGLNFKRPEFQRMQNDIFNGKVNMVIVKDFSRLGRDYIESGRYVKTIFPSLNVRFVSILDHFDSLSANASDVNLLLPVKNFVNDSYSRDISGKVRSHQAVMRENGLFVGAYVVYGYRKTTEDKNRIVPDTYAANIVKKIFAWKLQGMSAQAIADKLNRLGIMAPSEYKRLNGINYRSGFQKNISAKWFSLTVTRILKNRIYIGTLEQGKREKVNYKLDKIICKPEAEWNVIPNNHESLISRTDFETVSRLLSLDTRTAPQEETTFPFSALLFCHECGRSMVRRKYKRKDGASVFYICSSYNKGQGCSRHRIAEKNISEIVKKILQIHIGHLSNFNSDAVKREESIISEKELHLKHEALNQCQQMKLSLYNDYLDGIISENEYTQFHKIYETRAAEIENAIAAYQEESAKLYHKSLIANEWLIDFIHNKTLRDLSRNLLLSLIRKIIVHENCCLKIVFKYQDVYAAAGKTAKLLPKVSKQEARSIG